MALPKTDTFTVASNQRISTYNASWVEQSTCQWTILAASDDVYASANSSDSENACHWEGDTFSNDQYGQIVANAITSGQIIGAACRAASGTTKTYYGYYSGVALANDAYLFKNVAGTWTQLGSTAAKVTVGNTMKITASGTTITPYKNGSTTGTPGAQTDSAIASGYAGICGYVGGTGTRADSFEGGNLANGIPFFLQTDLKHGGLLSMAGGMQ